MGRMDAPDPDLMREETNASFDPPPFHAGSHRLVNLEFTFTS